ncbi:ChaN family lipoprotein [Epibacterium sp. MM17-32]|nr:ChaN family lipoprotein [Epibacterium sp. MM17-32]
MRMTTGTRRAGLPGPARAIAGHLKALTQLTLAGWIVVWVLCLFGPAMAQSEVSPDLLRRATQADIVILGEVHDNPDHHRTQAALISEIAPAAVVWEMLTQQQAARLTPEALQAADDLPQVLAWQQSGWPEFSLYRPVFEAARAARHWGAAVPRADARTAMRAGVISFFGADADRFGLEMPLAAPEQAQREADQQAAHCNALPEHLLPAMVDIQRLRDATLARAALAALTETGGPVVVITGNGHARRDRGVPVYLHRASDEVAVFALGQAEAGRIEGDFDAVVSAPPVERPDPCAAFD